MMSIVKDLREEMGLSQKELGSLVGVSRQTINKIEVSNSNVSVKLAYRISQVFGRLIEEVFIFNGEESGAD